MNKSLLKTTLAVALSAVSVSVFASTYAPSAQAPDQVVASFGRLLNHTPATTAVAVPAASKSEMDPLPASVNAVLWEQPSYHLPVKSTSLSVKPQKKHMIHDRP